MNKKNTIILIVVIVFILSLVSILLEKKQKEELQVPETVIAEQKIVPDSIESINKDLNTVNTNNATDEDMMPIDTEMKNL